MMMMMKIIVTTVTTLIVLNSSSCTIHNDNCCYVVTAFLPTSTIPLRSALLYQQQQQKQQQQQQSNNHNGIQLSLSSSVPTTRRRKTSCRQQQQQQQKQQLRLQNQILQYDNNNNNNLKSQIVVSTRTTATLHSTPSNNNNNDTIENSSSSSNNSNNNNNDSVSSSSSSSNTILRDTKTEAQDALNSVGWSIPTTLIRGSGATENNNNNNNNNESNNSENVQQQFGIMTDVIEGDLSSTDPFVQMIDSSIQQDIGVSLEDLLNPAKVVNLERDLYNYRIQLATVTGIIETITPLLVSRTKPLTTMECDNGGGGIEADEIRKMIQKKEAQLAIERRSVFRNWSKNLFLIQAIFSFGISYIMATNAQLLFGSYEWYLNPRYNMDISISVLGYWWWWLFVIPSLRSRRPKGYEKQALDIAFLASPIISLLEPIITKDTGIIWMTNCVVVVSAYAYSYLQYNMATDDDDDDDDNDNDASKPEWIKFIYKSLDFGTGRERGARN